MESLSDKLKSLGVHRGLGNPKRQGPVNNGQSYFLEKFPIETVVKGFYFDTHFGTTFISEQLFKEDAQKGTSIENASLRSPILAQWANIPGLFSKGLSGVAYLDTETSGLSGGTGTFVFLVGIGFYVDEGFKLIQIFMRDPGQETAFLAAFATFLHPFDTIITFNGRNFDIPILNTRHVLNGFSSPFLSLNHIDLLPLARRLWRNRLPSRSLANLEKEILGVQRSGEEVPGWMIPELYFHYLRTEDARPLQGVFYHNAVDIRSLASLLNNIAAMLTNPTENPALPGLDLVAIAKLYEENQEWEMAIRLYELGLAQGLPKEFFLLTLERFAQLYRRQEKWEDAVNVWKRAAEHKHINAYIELAKYYEHHLRDYDQAILWAQIAIEQVLITEKNLFRQDSTKELQKRLDRLLKKKKVL